MSSANFITARDLFLAHHWKRYIAFDSSRHVDFTCGRIVSKDGDRITLAIAAHGASPVVSAGVPVTRWSEMSLREPKAAESAPPASEVLTVGDWVGIGHQGNVILFAPCAQRGITAIQEGVELATRAEAWAKFLEKVRFFFRDKGFIEMTTPSLAPSPGTEPFLDPLKIEVEADGEKRTKYLITSPEFHLKQSLGAGLSRVFEIARCFRNREGGSHHRVEFHMLEWYRTFASLQEIADDVEALIRSFRADVRLKRVTMRELFQEFVGFALEPSSAREQLAQAAARASVRTTADDDFNDIFHRIFLEKIEPRLSEYASGGPLLIAGYPPSMAALARVGDDGFADRFEIYWQGIELCNAFHELNDPSENRQRFEKDNQEKQRSGRETVPLDEDLLRSFDRGIPPAGGIALGLERLFMVAHGLADIDAVRPFQR